MARFGWSPLLWAALVLGLGLQPVCAFGQAASPEAAEPSGGPPAAPGDDAEPAQFEALQHAARRAADTVRGQAVTLGLGYGQTTAKLYFKDLDKGRAQITDNGTLVPLVQYASQESYFWESPLRTGRVAVGYNLVANYAAFSLNRQLTVGPFQGANVGTRVTGSYLAAAPLVFVRLGPLYPEREIFWKFGVGVGAAALQYKGTVIATTAGGGRYLEPVAKNADSLSVYTTEVWEVQVERWSLLFKGAQSSGSARHGNFTLEEYSLTLAYAFTF